MFFQQNTTASEWHNFTYAGKKICAKIEDGTVWFQFSQICELLGVAEEEYEDVVDDAEDFILNDIGVLMVIRESPTQNALALRRWLLTSVIPEIYDICAPQQ